jgi:hypothetical protein
MLQFEYKYEHITPVEAYKKFFVTTMKIYREKICAKQISCIYNSLALCGTI